MNRIGINPRLPVAAAVAAIVVALISLIMHEFVVSAMGWLLFEILAVVSAIVITTPVPAARWRQDTLVSEPLKRARTAKIYQSPSTTGKFALEETVIRDEDAA